MYEAFEENWQPLYQDLRLYWLLMLLVDVLGLLDSTVVSIISVILGIVQLYALYRMRTISLRMEKAFRWNIIGLVVVIAGLVLAVVAVCTAAANPMVYLTGNSTMVAFLMLLVALAGAVITVIASYFFYTALDDLAVVRGYDYPAGRIKWCFWLSIIIAVVSAVLELAMPGAARIGSLVLQVVILVLLWQYLQAVRRSEQGE